MGTMNHFGVGWLTPALSYVMACAGAALGLRCTRRALSASGAKRRNRLLAAAVAIGSGVWTMHFVAMFGFAVDGAELRYDVPLTVLSLLVAFNVVNMHNQWVAAIWRSINALLEPLLRPIRRIMPDTGAIDFSPLVLIVLLNIVNIVFANLALASV